MPNHEHGFSIPLSATGSGERDIRGGYSGSCVPRRDARRYLELYRRGRLSLDRLKSAEGGFTERNREFDRLADGAVVRQLLLPHSGV